MKTRQKFALSLLQSLCCGGLFFSNLALANTTAPIDASKNAAPNEVSAPATATTMRFQQFAEFRHEILAKIGAAKSRIWLATDFLSDGDISSALYMAQYRKIDVQIMLGKYRVHQYMSRLRYLESQKIPVFLIPDSYPKSIPVTAILIDDNFLTANRSLDFLLKSSEVTMQIQPNKAKDFSEVFARGFANKISAKSIPLPNVGRPSSIDNAWKPSSNGGKTYQPASAYAPKSYSSSSYNTKKGEDNTETYYYQKQKNERPEGIPAQLPKKTKQQLKNNLSPTP